MEACDDTFNKTSESLAKDSDLQDFISSLHHR